MLFKYTHTHTHRPFSKNHFFGLRRPQKDISGENSISKI
uniref:Hhh motif-containing secreted peptide n=1 Tax=Triatoma infestans TaxID=30076 RepID=A0A161MIY5_TRIIF